jgi:AbiV family abortive infection protein
MAKFKKKAKYPHSLSFLKHGYLAIKDTVSQLVDSSSVLLESGAHSQAASLAVIALEECGKIFLLDSLLFSKPGDDSVKGFKKGSINHKYKLFALQFFITFLKSLSEHDKRYGDERFRKAIQIGILNLHQNYKQLRDSMPASNRHELDRIKQEGFYTKIEGQDFSPTTKTLSFDVAARINQLAAAMKANMDFIMTPQAVSAYVKAGKDLRSEISVDDWENILDIVEENVGALLAQVTPETQ